MKYAKQIIIMVQQKEIEPSVSPFMPIKTQYYTKYKNIQLSALTKIEEFNNLPVNIFDRVPLF